MAKKGNRQLFALECEVCHNKNYVTEKNVIKTKDKLNMSKFCNSCRKHTEHAESKLK